MGVYKFERPELDEEIITALEQKSETERVLRYFVEQRAAIGKIRDALPRNARRELPEMLSEELASLDHDIGTAQEVAAEWGEIIELLMARTARK